MSCADIKIEVGMIIQSKTLKPNQYKITKIIPYSGRLTAYASLIQKDGVLRSEESFGYLTEDGRPGGWGPSWDIVNATKTQVSTTTNAEEDYSNKMLNFFRTSSHPENCSKCGAPKPCSYHP